MVHSKDIPKKKTAEGRTIVIDVSQFHKGKAPEPEGGGGIGISIGKHVKGGGVVTGTTDTTVTIQFPDGLPEGPITLPGKETTVVIEHIDPAGGQEGDGIVIAPWGPSDTIPVPAVSPGAVVSGDGMPLGGMQRSFLLPTPGSFKNTVRLPPEFNKIIFSPTNTSSCPCSIFIGSIDRNGNISANHVMLDPDQSVPVYQAEPGSTGIIVAASAGCEGQDCQAELTISVPVA